MSDTQRAAVALRNIIVGSLGVVDSTDPSDSLDGVNTTELPNGALAYVLTNGGGTYRLNKLNSTTAQTVDGSVIAPLAGPGRWFFVGNSIGSDPRVAQSQGGVGLQSSSSFAVVQDTWIALPSGSNFYGFGRQSSYWTLDTTTGVYTYTGPTGAAFLMTAQATVASATAAEVIEFALMTGSGSVIGTTTFVGSAGRTTVDTTTVALGAQLTTQRSQGMTTGDTFFGAVRNRSGAHNLTVTQYNLIIQPA
jgi:hypothetical protein